MSDDGPSMFDPILERLREALTDLERIRDGAAKAGFELEEIHLRLLKLQVAIRHTAKARRAFRAAIDPDEDDDESNDLPEDE